LNISERRDSVLSDILDVPKKNSTKLYWKGSKLTKDIGKSKFYKTERGANKLCELLNSTYTTGKKIKLNEMNLVSDVKNYRTYFSSSYELVVDSGSCFKVVEISDSYNNHIDEELKKLDDYYQSNKEKLLSKKV
jgi:hypothetical protein